MVIVPLAAIKVSNLDNLDDGLEHGTWDVCYLHNVKEIKEN